MSYGYDFRLLRDLPNLGALVTDLFFVILYF